MSPDRRPDRSAGSDPNDPVERERRWTAESGAHDLQVNAWRFLPSTGHRRSATSVPASFTYWTIVPAGPVIRGLAVAVVVIWWVVVAISRSPGEAWSAVLEPAIVAVAVTIASTQRLSVGRHGLSFDFGAISRVSVTGFVPLFAVTDAAAGTRPADWPRGRRRGCWLPGRRAVHVRYVDARGGVRVTTTWVRRPGEFVAAVTGRPEPA